MNKADELTILLNENRLLGERCNQLLKDKGELTDKIADIKANCDLAIEGRDIKIKELEKENERLKGDLELWESGGCRATNLFECGVVKELKERLAETNLNGNIVLRELTKAKEHIQTLISCLIDWVQEGDKDYCYIADAEQFLKEIEK